MQRTERPVRGQMQGGREPARPERGWGRQREGGREGENPVSLG